MFVFFTFINNFQEEQARATAPPPSEISLSIPSSADRHPPSSIINGGVENNGKRNGQSQRFDLQIGGTSTTPMERKMEQKAQQRQGGGGGQDELASIYASMELSATTPAEEELEAGEDIAETSGFCRALKERVSFQLEIIRLCGWIDQNLNGLDNFWILKC